MSLSTLCKVRKPFVNEIDPENIKENLSYYQNLIDYWRMYPDHFVDYLCSLNPDNSFHFYFIQRIILRIIMRYKMTYLTFSRGFSKSFLAVLSLILKAVLYPGANIATVADQKGQSAAILQAKMEEIMRLIPALRREVRWDTKGQISKTMTTKDAVSYSFKNGSKIANHAIAEQTRGQRFQALLVEEVATVNQKLFQEVIMPTLVVSRKVGRTGESDPLEVLNQSATFITSAGFKNTFAYDKLIDLTCRMVGDRTGHDSFIIGGDYRIPIVEGLQPQDFIQKQNDDISMDESSFEREYGSIWGGSLEGAFFNLTQFDQGRIIREAEEKHIAKPKGSYYVLGVDVGRFSDLTEICVIKVHQSAKTLVNLYTLDEMPFRQQAIMIKRVFNKFQCRIAVVDGNGLGAGLIDELVLDQVDPDTGETLWNMGVANDDEKRYKQFETTDTLKGALYIMKANAAINSEMYSYCQAQLSNGNLFFLVDETQAKGLYLETAAGQKNNPLSRALYLRPHVETSVLKSQLANMVLDANNSDSSTVILKRANAKIKKDKVSAYCYGLYWIALQERRARKKRHRDFSKFIFKS